MCIWMLMCCVRWCSSMLYLRVHMCLCLCCRDLFFFLSSLHFSFFCCFHFTSHIRNSCVFVRSHTLFPVCSLDSVFSLGCTIKLNCCARLCCVAVCALISLAYFGPSSSIDNPVLHDHRRHQSQIHTVD